MIIDRHNDEQKRHDPPFEVALRSAYLLTEAQEPYKSYEGRSVQTTFTMRYDHFRPYFGLSMNLSPRSNKKGLSTGIKNLNIAETTQETADGNNEKEVYLFFTKGTLIKSWNKQEYESNTGNFTELSEMTKVMMSSMSTPVLLIFSGANHNMLTINLPLNCPKFAEGVRQQVFSKMFVRVLIDVGSNTAKFNTLKNYMQAVRGPLERFLPKGLHAPDRFDLKYFVANPMPQNMLGVRVLSVFKDGDEFTVNGLARAELDRAPEIRQIEKYQDSRKTLVLADVHGEDLIKCYEGLVNRPGRGEYALQPGDKISIEFEDDEVKSGGILWRATVMRTESKARKDMLSVLVHRGYDEDSQKYSGFQPSTIDARDMSEDELLEKLKDDIGNNVSVKIVDCESTFTNIRAAYMDLNLPVSKAASPFRARIKSVLLGRRPDLLKSKDLYHHIRTGDFDPQKYMMPLNSQQLEVVQAARSMRGGMQFTQGPPGTGKTRTLLQQAAPFPAADTTNMILLAAPTNHGADDLAQGMGEIVAGLKMNHPRVKAKKPYVLRAYPEKTEEEIFKTQGRKFVVPLSEVVKFDKAISTPSTETTDRHKRMEEYRAADKPKFDGVHDKRVTDVESSVGYMKLLICGIIPDSEHAYPDPGAFAAFRKLYKKRAEGRKLTISEASLWESESDKLTKLAVQGASVIVSTTATISKAALLGHVKDKVMAVFMDESAFEREDSLMPLFAAHFSLDPCFVMAGDQQQLVPLAKASEEENAFRPQIELSFMTRMINLGWEYIMLTEQHRMVPEISAIANALTYENKLINDPSTEVCNRPLAQKFRQFAEKRYGILTNRLMIDLPSSRTNKVTRNDRSSKCNDFSICIIAELVKILLMEFGSEASIGVLTPYKGQRLSYERMEAMMRELELENFDMVTVDTLDGAQGRQFDIVILDLVVGDSAGFLESENRLNVAMTRAKDGFIVVCDRSAIASAYYKNKSSTPYMKKMVRMFEGQTKRRRQDDEYPKTRFFTPADVESTWVSNVDFSISDFFGYF